MLSVKRPGQKGTQGLVERYGARLVCVRYRYDATTQQRCKTVELIVEQQHWTPPPEPDYSPAPPLKSARRIGVRVGYHETALRQQVKAAGGTWSKDEKLWRVPSDRIAAFGLQSRVVKG